MVVIVGIGEGEAVHRSLIGLAHQGFHVRSLRRLQRTVDETARGTDLGKEALGEGEGVVAQVEDGIELVAVAPIVVQCDAVGVENRHIARGVLLLVVEELLQFFLIADDDGVTRRTEVVADIGCHIVCPGLDICRDENLAALSGKGDRDDEVFASLQVVCLVELAALLVLIVRQFSIIAIP